MKLCRKRYVEFNGGHKSLKNKFLEGHLKSVEVPILILQDRYVTHRETEATTGITGNKP